MRTQFHVRVLMNEGEGRFDAYRPGDFLAKGMTLILDVDDEAKPNLVAPSRRSFDSMCHEALDRAWAVGNRQGVDDAQQEWPSSVRSISVGDVLIIGENAWAVARFGFEAIEGAAVAWSLSERAVLSTRGVAPAVMREATIRQVALTSADA